MSKEETERGERLHTSFSGHVFRVVFEASDTKQDKSCQYRYLEHDPEEGPYCERREPYQMRREMQREVGN